MSRKINKKLLGGAGLNKPSPINIEFNKIIYIFILDKLGGDGFDPKPDSPDDKTEYIYTGLSHVDSNIVFGDVIGSKVLVTHKELKTDKNREIINKFKLHIMSIMANYPIKLVTKDSYVYKEITPLLNPINIPKIMDILKIPAIVKPVAPPASNLSDNDMLELNIYKEFGIKCILKGECYKYIEGKFFHNNPTIKRNQLKDSTFRDLYVNLFDYITGSEISVFSKEKGLLSCVEKIDVALKDLKPLLTEYVFNGARTNYKFNIKTLIKCMNDIRVKVNTSLEITGGYHISKEIFV